MKTPLRPFPDVIGKSFEEAKKVYLKIRRRSIDEKPMAGTADLQPDRLNVKTEKNIITEIIGWG